MNTQLAPDISCIEAGKWAPKREELDPRAILDSTLPLVAVQAASQNLRLVDETLDQSLPWCAATKSVSARYS